MEKTKILYINHVAYIGGAEIALLDLLRHVDRTQYTPVVFVPKGALADAVQQLDVRCVHIPVLPGLNRYTLPGVLSKLPRLISMISREQPALMHANTNFTSLYSGLISKMTKIPSVGLIQDIEPFGRMGRGMVRQNTKVIAISDAVRAYLVAESVPEKNIVRIHHGVDLQKYQFCQEEQEHSPSEVIIGIVGQLGERKGHLYLLEAVREIVQTTPHVRLWIVGKEPEHSPEGYTQALYHYVEQAHLEQQVKFWGFQKDIPEILAQLDILVLASLQEPFGKIVIEAMAMGKPVVASEVGGVPEIVLDGKTGLLVPPKDAVALRQALALLIKHQEKRTQMGIEGRRRVEQRFSIERTVRNTEQLYEQILKA